MTFPAALGVNGLLRLANTIVDRAREEPLNIYVLNKSTALTDTQIQHWLPAFNVFLGHVQEWWPRPAALVWCPRNKEPKDAWKLVFADKSDEAGALGYHDFTPDGRPISYVFAADDIEGGYNPAVTATHEIAEMIADPWISESFQVSNTEFFAKEICDPCEAEEFGYSIRVKLYRPCWSRTSCCRSGSSRDRRGSSTGRRRSTSR